MFTHTEPPAPTDDDMLPEWRRSEPLDALYRFQDELQGTEVPWSGQDASISIQHLCGYNYTREGYVYYAKFLESCGFHCMRSRRGEDSRYWEIWFLPGLWAAEGLLATEIADIPKDERLKYALLFLKREAVFGTLDVSYRRLAQVLE